MGVLSRSPLRGYVTSPDLDLHPALWALLIILLTFGNLPGPAWPLERFPLRQLPTSGQSAGRRRAGCIEQRWASFSSPAHAGVQQTQTKQVPKKTPTSLWPVPGSRRRPAGSFFCLVLSHCQASSGVSFLYQGSQRLRKLQKIPGESSEVCVACVLGLFKAPEDLPTCFS